MAEFLNIEAAMAALRGDNDGREGELPVDSVEVDTIEPSPSTTPVTNRALRQAEFSSIQEARGAFGGSLVGATPQTQPPSVPRSLTGLPATQADPLAGVDVRTGADFGLRARASLLPTTEEKKISIENALRDRGIDIKANPVEVVDGFFPNFVIPVPDEDSPTGYKRVLFDPTGATSIPELIKDVGGDLAGEIIQVALGLKAASKLATAGKTIRPTIGRIFKESVPPSVGLAVQTRAARQYEGIPQPTGLEEMGEVGMGLGFDVAGGAALSLAPRLLGRNYGKDVLGKQEVQTYREAVEDFNARFGQSYQPTAGTILMDEDLLVLENYLATQSPIYSSQLKQIKTEEKKAIKSAVIQMLQDFDPDIKALKPENISPVDAIKESYLRDIRSAEVATAEASRDLLVKATDQMFKEIDKLSPSTRIKSPEQAGSAIRNFIQESKDIFQQQSNKNYAVVEAEIDRIQRTAPTSANWNTLVSMDSVNSVIDGEVKLGGLALAEIPSKIKTFIADNKDGLDIRKARSLRRVLADVLVQEKIKSPTGSSTTNLLGRLSSALEKQLDGAVDSLPTPDLKDALSNANSEYRRYKDLFKVDILQRIANQTARGELNEGSILPRILGNEKSYFDLKKTMQALPASEAGSPELRWPSIKKNMLASVLNVTGEGSDQVAFSELYQSIKRLNPRVRKDLLGKDHAKVVQFFKDMAQVVPGESDSLIKAPKQDVLKYLQDPSLKDVKSSLIKAHNEAKQLLNIEQKNSFTKALARLNKNALDTEANSLIKSEGFISRAIEKSDLKSLTDMMNRIVDPSTRDTARRNVVRQLFEDSGILTELYQGGTLKSGDKLYNKLLKHGPKFKAVLGDEVFSDLTSLATVASRTRISQKEAGESAGSLARGRVLRDLLSFKFLDLIGDLRMRVGASILANPKLVEGFVESGRRNPGSFGVWASILTAPDFVENLRTGYNDMYAFTKDYSLLMDAVGIAEGMLDEPPQPDESQPQPQPQPEPEPVQQ